MKAIIMRRFGGPDVLELEELEPPPLGPNEVRVRMLAAAVNHSDLEIRTGAWKIRKPNPFPYVPGLEVVGEVIDIGRRVHGLRFGERVITMMQGLGGVRAVRHGGYQELVTVEADALAILPQALDPLAAAAHGLAAVTAHQALEATGSTGTVCVTGAAGGVGSLAVAIAAKRGAKVIAVARSPEASAYLTGLGAAQVIADAAQLPPESLDACIDTVAGPVFEHVASALAPNARYCCVGAAGGDRVAFSAWKLLDGVTLTGYSSETLDGPALRTAIADILALALPAPEMTVLPLARAADAHRLYELGGVRGRVILTPG